MKKIAKTLILSILSAILYLSANAQTDTDFWFCVPEVTYEHVPDELTFLHVSALDAPATVTIEMPLQSKFNPITATVNENSSIEIDLTSFLKKNGANDDQNILESGLKGESCVIKDKGIHIKSTSLINVYLERGHGKHNNCELWALKGQNAYGKNFVVPSQNDYYNYTYKLKNNKYDEDAGYTNPGAWNSIDIVAVEEDCDVTVIPSNPIIDNRTQDGTLKKGTPKKFKLKKGQTLSLRATSHDKDKHLGGTIITSNKKIAVQWKDDSIMSTDNNSYDVIGDQIIPTDLAGTEYIVMRGQLGEGNGNKSLEYVYIYATESNTTVSFATPNGDVIDKDGNVVTMNLAEPGESNHIPLNNNTYNKDTKFGKKDYDALYIKADKPVIVAHVSGFGGEMGAAIIPKIGECIGSYVVYASVAFASNNGKQDDQGFFLNIMTQKSNLEHFKITITKKNSTYSGTIPSTWFKEIPGTDANGNNWCYLDRGHNKFSIKQNGSDIPAVETGDVVRVENTGRFHMGVINGGAQGGCRYGYFSDFGNTQEPEFLVATSGSDYTDFCFGDTITLQASNGKTYEWKYAKGDATWNTFVDPNTNSSPKVRPAIGENTYHVKIERDVCKQEDKIVEGDVIVYGIEPPSSKFEIDYTPCSPSEVSIKNTSERADTYLWTIEYEPDNDVKSNDEDITLLQLPNSNVVRSNLDSIGILHFTNNSATKSKYNITLKTSFSNACPKTYSKSIAVCPTGQPRLNADKAKGCQPLNVKFDMKNTSGAYNKIILDYGDGTKKEEPTSIAKTYDHTYANNSTKDTIYIATLTVEYKDPDDPNIVCSNTDTVKIRVFGKVKAQYIIDKTTDCSPLEATFTNYSIGDANTKYKWNVEKTLPNTDANGYIQNKNPFKLTYENNGADKIQYKYIGLTAVRTNIDGSTCEDRLYYRDTLTIYPAFSVDYEVTPITGCDPLTATFTNKSSDRSSSTQFLWHLGDGTTEKSSGTFEHTYYHTLPERQYYTTSLVGESKFGCRDSISNNIIEVMPYLNPNFTIDKVSGCSPLYVTITNNTPGHAYKGSSQWNIDYPYTKVSGSLDNTAVLKFENKSGIRKLATITLTESTEYNNACTKQYEKTVEIFPEINAALSADQQKVCDSTVVTFKNNALFTNVSSAPSEYYWLFGDGASTTTKTNNDIKHLYRNNSGSTGTNYQDYTVTLVASANGCSDTAKITVSVAPKIQAIFSSDNYNVCTPDTIIIKNNSKGANKFVFSFSDGTADIIKSDMNDLKYYVSNSSPWGVATKTVSMIASNGSCYSSPAIKTYQAYPAVTPKLDVTPAAGCGPLDVTISQTSTGANIFLLEFGDGVTDETGNSSITHLYSNPTNTDKTYTLKLTATNSLGCSNETTKTVTVYPEISSAFTYEKSSECSPMGVSIINNSTNGSRFEWNFGDGTSDVKTDKEKFLHNYSNNSTDGKSISTYSIELKTIDANHTMCRDSVKHEIKIYPQVIAYFEADNNSGCSPLTTSFANKSKGYGLTYTWDYAHDNAKSAIADDTHTHTFDNLEATTHTYNVQLIATDINKCSDTMTIPVKAHPHVIADFAYTKDEACTPYPVTFNYADAAINGNKFEWDFGFDGKNAIKKDKSSFSFTFDNTTLNDVKQYSISLVSTDTITGCSDNTSKTIEVYPQLKPAFTQDILEGCNPLPVKFTNQTTGLAAYLWDFGDSQSSAEANPAHVFKHFETTDQTYNVKLKATQTATGCEKTVNQNILTYSYVNAKFGINDTGNNANGAAATILGGCTPFEVNITDSSKLNPAGTWSWNFGDGTTSNIRQPNSRTYTNPDKTAPLEDKKYTISLIVTNDHGCSHDTAQTIAVYPRSIPNFGGDFAGCEPHTVTFIDSSLVDSKTQYFWTFSDGSSVVDQPPFSKIFHNYNYTENKEYTVNLKTTTEYNCTDEITKKVVVYPKPLASFSPLADRACPPFEAEFKNNSKGNGMSFLWDFGNGTNSRTSSTGNKKALYTNDTNEPITFNVTLIAKSDYGCTDTMTNPMITFPNVIVDFDYEPTGCSPHTINIKNKSTQTTTNHLWQFGEGSTSVAEEPTFTYYNTSDNDQTLTITYIGSSKYQCTDTIKKDVTVYINPNVDFVAHAPSQRYPDDTVYFENYTQEGPWKYSWNFGDGNTSNTNEKYFMYKYGKWAANEDSNIFHVTLHIESEHCQNTITHDVTILPPYPKIEILNQRPAGCVPYTVQFAVNEEYCNTYEWNFEDGTTSTESEPQHTFTEPGIYNVKLTAEGDGGSHYDYEIITVYELPEPDFTASPKFVMLPNQPVQFFNASHNGNTYIWDFGDGTYSTELNPAHQYEKEGFYDVKLIAYSSQMCTDSVTKYQDIEVSGAGYIKYPNAFIPSDDSPSDGTYPTPDDMNNIFHPVWFGVKEYDLWIFNRWGEQLFHSTDVNVGWNGKYANDGKELGQDVYFWKAKGKFENNTPFKLAGDVTLIRK